MSALVLRAPGRVCQDWHVYPCGVAGRVSVSVYRTVGRRPHRAGVLELDVAAVRLRVEAGWVPVGGSLDALLAAADRGLSYDDFAVVSLDALDVGGPALLGDRT